MRFALSTAAIALAMLTGSAAMTPATAADNNGRWCVSAPWQGEFNCTYRSLMRCKEFAAPSSGWCVLNPEWRR